MRGAKILELRFWGGIIMMFLVLMAPELWAQKGSTIRLLEFKYGYHLPLVDMKDRFGSNNDFGISFISIGAEQKWFLGLEGIFLFGSTVKEDVLASLRTYDGGIIGIDARHGDINLKERGFYTGAQAGRIFYTGTKADNLTGIRIQVGGGILQHKIRVQDNFKNIVALEKKYRKGYDRLTNGPAFHLGLGYEYQSPANNLHFHIMADLYGARTASRRDIDHTTGEYLDLKRTDILAGLSLAYIVTISRSRKPDHIYY